MHFLWFFFNINFILFGIISESCRPKFSFNRRMTGPSAESVTGLSVRGTSLSFMYSKRNALGGSPVCSRPSPTELLHYTKSCKGAVKWLVANVWILLSGGVTAGGLTSIPYISPYICASAIWGGPEVISNNKNLFILFLYI